MSEPASPTVSPSAPRCRWIRPLRRWLLFLSGLLLGTTIVLKLLENRLVYPADTAEQAWIEPPEADFEDVWLTSRNGTRLHAWFVPAKPDADVILFCHGNGGNLSHRGRMASQFREQFGRSVMLFDYPGYGKSAGEPSEEGCYGAGDAAIEWLMANRCVPRRLILFGESLGGGVATDLAIRHEHRVLVLAKTFTSLPAAAKAAFPMLPTHTLMRNRFDSVSKIGRVTTPVFIAHGTADRIVPFALGEELYASANEPKQFHRLEDQDHNAWFTSDFYVTLKQFLQRHTGE